MRLCGSLLALLLSCAGCAEEGPVSGQKADAPEEICAAAHVINAFCRTLKGKEDLIGIDGPIPEFLSKEYSGRIVVDGDVRMAFRKVVKEGILLATISDGAQGGGNRSVALKIEAKAAADL